jgi:hypothetical protein
VAAAESLILNQRLCDVEKGPSCRHNRPDSRFRFCGPSDDPDEQTAVTTGYRHLLVQLKRLAALLLPESDAAHLKALDVEVNNVYSAYDVHAEVEALLPDVEAALEGRSEDWPALGEQPVWIIESGLIERLARLRSPEFSPSLLVTMCNEINSSFRNGNLVATILLMRAVLNYVPPVFGRDTFSQVVANSGRSLRDSFDHLENGLRKIADFHTHRLLDSADLSPTRAQVEPFKPQFELLLQQAVAAVEARHESARFRKGGTADTQ